MELRPPAGCGFSGTALLPAGDKKLIDELIRRGYTKVDYERGNHGDSEGA